MHAFTIVLMPANTQDVREKIEELLAPYHVGLEVEPYKDYYRAKGVETLAERHGTGSDLNALVEKLKVEMSPDIDADKHGLYRMSTFNPKAKWDYKSIGGSYNRRVFNEKSAVIGEARGWDDHLSANVCFVSLLASDVIPGNLILSTGEWHECEDFGWRMMNAPEENQKAWVEWEKFARDLIQQYPDHLAVALDVHS